MSGVVPYLDPEAGAFMDPATVNATVAADDEDWSLFLAALHHRFRDKAFAAADVVRDLHRDFGRDGECLLDDLPDDLRARYDRSGLTARTLGVYLRNRVGRWHGGFVVRRAGVNRSNTALWQIRTIEPPHSAGEDHD